MRLILRTPPRFCFARTVFSHGWSGLAPFEVDPRGRWLRGVVRLPAGRGQAYTLRPCARGVSLEAPGASGSRRDLLRRAARNVLNLDLDLSEFYDRATGHPGLEWVADRGAGRLLRAPTVWEDLIKLVLTTNCSWSFTRRMVSGLVEGYGEPAPDGSRSFPGPGPLALAGAGELRERVRAGYRAPHLARLAAAVAEGRLDPESWADPGRDPVDLRREMLALPGVGPYVADNLLKLLGQPSGLGLDSWLRASYARVYHDGRRVTDRTIARRYSGLGPWAGLGLWCDMTRDWFENGQPVVAVE